MSQLEEFNNWLGTLNFKHIIFTAGNHDFNLEKEPDKCRKILSNCHLLMGEEITIDGLKFYGDPRLFHPIFYSFSIISGFCYINIIFI